MVGPWVVSYPDHTTSQEGRGFHTMPHTPFVIADLDGTLLHDAERF